MLLANNPDDVIEWNDFIDALDSDPTIYKQLNDIVAKEERKQKLLGEEQKEDGLKKS